MCFMERPTGAGAVLELTALTGLKSSFVVFWSWNAVASLSKFTEFLFHFSAKEKLKL